MPGRFASRRTEVVWTRTHSSAGGGGNSVRVRRNNGPWEAVSSDDLPPDLKGLLSGFGTFGDVLPDTAGSEVASPCRGRKRRVTDGDDELRLEHLWFGWSRWVETIVLAACGFFVAWHLATSHLAIRRWLAPFALAAGAYAAYWSFAVLRNRSTFVVRQGRLTVRHGPLPMPFQKGLDGERVRQLYVSFRRTSRGYARYDLRVRTADGEDVTLLDNVRSKTEAIRLERAIERHLGIIDDPDFGD